MPIKFSTAPEYSVICKQLVIYTSATNIAIYDSDADYWYISNFVRIPSEIPIITLDGCIIFGEYIVIYSMHDIFYISIVTVKRRQCYSYFTDARDELQFCRLIPMKQDRDINSNPNIYESYYKLHITQYQILDTNPRTFFITGMIYVNSEPLFVSFTISSKYHKTYKYYYIYVLHINNDEMFTSLRKKIAKCFSFINPLDLFHTHFPYLYE